MSNHLCLCNLFSYLKCHATQSYSNAISNYFIAPLPSSLPKLWYAPWVFYPLTLIPTRVFATSVHPGSLLHQSHPVTIMDPLLLVLTFFGGSESSVMPTPLRPSIPSPATILHYGTTATLHMTFNTEVLVPTLLEVAQLSCLRYCSSHTGLNICQYSLPCAPCHNLACALRYPPTTTHLC